MNKRMKKKNGKIPQLPSEKERPANSTTHKGLWPVAHKQDEGGRKRGTDGGRCKRKRLAFIRETRLSREKKPWGSTPSKNTPLGRGLDRF